MANAANLRAKLGALPFPVQAFRAGSWRIVSTHMSEAAADKGMKTIRRCTPEQHDSYRVVHIEEPDFIR